jgi:hypothetical protein
VVASTTGGGESRRQGRYGLPPAQVATRAARERARERRLRGVVMPETLAFEIRDHLCLIGLARPAKRNAFNLSMLRELAEAYTEYERDATARGRRAH